MIKRAQDFPVRYSDTKQFYVGMYAQLNTNKTPVYEVNREAPGWTIPINSCRFPAYSREDFFERPLVGEHCE